MHPRIFTHSGTSRLTAPDSVREKRLASRKKRRNFRSTLSKVSGRQRPFEMQASPHTGMFQPGLPTIVFALSERVGGHNFQFSY